MKFIIDLKIRYLFYLIIVSLFLLPFLSLIDVHESIVVIWNILFWFVWFPIFLIQIFNKIYKKENVVSLELNNEFKILSKISWWFFIISLTISIIVFLINPEIIYRLIIPNHWIWGGSNLWWLYVVGLILAIFNIPLCIFLKVSLFFMKKITRI